MAERLVERQRTTLIDRRVEWLQEPLTHRVAFVGVGAGTLGLLARADAMGRLNALLQQGAGFYDDHPFGSQTLNFLCDPNSSKKDFKGIIAETGLFGSVLQGPAAILMEEGTPIDLRHANGLYTELGEKLTEILDQYPNSAAISERVSYVVYDPFVSADDPRRFTLYGGEDHEEKRVIGYANKVVFGTGGSQELSPRHVLREGQQAYTVEEVLFGDQRNIGELYTALKSLPPEQRRITGLGLSHGLLATCVELLEYDEAHDTIFGEGAIQILARGEPELYFSKRDEVEAVYEQLGREVREDLFAPNDAYARLTGVRSGTDGRYGAKDLYLSVKDGTEKRVTINLRPDAENLWEDGLVAESPIVIQGFGLQTNLVPVFQREQNGRLNVISVVNEKGNVTVGELSNMQTAVGNDIGLFGSGIGYPHSVRSDAISKFAASGEAPERVGAANLSGTDLADELIQGLGF